MKKNVNTNDQAIEATVFQAIRSLGWLLPQTEDGVRAIAIDEDGITLPPSLLDPMNALSPRYRHQPIAEPDVWDPLLVDELAQAARQGAGAIPAEVAERMRRDRDAAERKMEPGENE